MHGGGGPWQSGRDSAFPSYCDILAAERVAEASSSGLGGCLRKWKGVCRGPLAAPETAPLLPQGPSEDLLRLSIC